jgi:hypothetical protein
MKSKKNEFDSEPDIHGVYIFADAIAVRHCPYCGSENAGEAGVARTIAFRCSQCDAEYSFPVTEQINRVIIKQLIKRRGYFGAAWKEYHQLFRTEEQWTSLPDGTHYFTFPAPDGAPASISLTVSGGRGKVRHFVFDIHGSNWNIKLGASDHLLRCHQDYARHQHTKQRLRCSVGNCTVSMDCLREDTGKWLYRVAQFLADPHNLYDSIVDLDPSSREFVLWCRRRWLSDLKKFESGGSDACT